MSDYTRHLSLFMQRGVRDCRGWGVRVFCLMRAEGPTWKCWTLALRLPWGYCLQFQLSRSFADADSEAFH